MTSADVRLSDNDLTRLRQVLSRAAGLHFEDSRRDSLGYCVAERLRCTGIADVATYLDLLGAPGSPEQQCLLDEVTVQETHFFRNPPQMSALRGHVLPELVRAATTGARRLRVWSAGCSTGEEPYTVAIMLRELLPNVAGWDVRVLATDLSLTALQAARRATYGERAVALASPEQRSRWFVPNADGAYEVRPAVRELVHFAHHNLVGDRPPDELFDLILCRNVTIYFDRSTTRALMSRLHGALRPGGYLLLGSAETLWQVNDDFRLVSVDAGDSTAYVYRRRDAAEGAKEAAASVGPGPAHRPAVARRVRAAPAPRRPVSAGAVSAGAVVPAGAAAVRVALDEGRYEQAAEMARRAADLDPLQPELHYLWGRALVDLGRDGEALPVLRRAVYLEPEAGLAHFLLAGALSRTGAAAAAAREYRAAAATLGRPADEAASELGGRSAAELAALCAQLGSELSGRAEQVGAASRSSR